MAATIPRRSKSICTKFPRFPAQATIVLRQIGQTSGTRTNFRDISSSIYLLVLPATTSTTTAATTTNTVLWHPGAFQRFAFPLEGAMGQPVGRLDDR